MFKDELFIYDAMKNIYGFKNSENHNFSGTKEHPNISDDDYKIFDAYLEQTKKVNLKTLIGGLNLLAYGFKNDKSTIIDYIKNNSSNIIQQMDKIIPDLQPEYNEIAIQYYSKLLNGDFSYNLIKDLEISHPPKLSEKYYYGLKYLLLFWATNCYNDFEQWYFSTERKDLLLYFISTILDSHHIINATDNVFTTSKINWLRALNHLLTYPISNIFPFADKDKKVSDILNSPIENKEKVDLVLYYLFQNFGTLNEAYTENNKEQFFQIINLLKQVDINNYFSIEYVKSLNLWIYRYYIVYEILTNIDIDSKDIIYEYILDLIDKYQDKDILTANDILLANLYGHIILNLNDTFVKNIEQKFLRIKRDLFKPYFYNRKHEEWNRYIAKAIYYTIILYDINYPNKEKCNQLISDFLEIKKGLRHYLDNDINQFIKDMEEQINKIQFS